MKICSGDLTDITNAVNNTGRADHVARGIARVVAMERMRVRARQFVGYGLPQFAGRTIYKIRHDYDFGSHVRRLPIVGK